jgi:RsiW-degrading membrane proteinase PrsW (M82 family)
MIQLVLTIILLLVLAFLPPLIYLRWIRNTERYGKEPWSRLMVTFFWGAIMAIAIAVVLQVFILFFYGLSLEREYEWLKDGSIRMLVMVCVIAPFTEEFAKGIGVFSAKRQINEVEDGLVYGAGCGLGFAATENLLYEGNAFFSIGEKGLMVFLLFVIIRSISSVLLHASATSATGYGISKSLVLGKKFCIIPYFLLAVLMHSVYNFFASFGVLYAESLGNVAYLVGLVVAIAFAMGSIGVTRRKIRKLD